MKAGSTAAVPAGELVYWAVITGHPAGGYTPGGGQGISYTTRISADSGSLDESDITSSAAGNQQGTATLSASSDWYAVAATFQPLPANEQPADGTDRAVRHERCLQPGVAPVVRVHRQRPGLYGLPERNRYRGDQGNNLPRSDGRARHQLHVHG